MGTLSERLALAVAAATLVHLAQIPYFWPDVPLDASFFAGHLLVVLGIQAGLAVGLGEWRQRRGWATAAMLLPVAVALWGGSVSKHVPLEVWRGLGIIAVLLGGRWLVLASPGPASPIIAALAGAILAAEWSRFRSEVYQGFLTPIAEWARFGLFAIPAAALGAFAFSGRARPRLGVTSALLVALVSAAGAGALGLTRLGSPRYSPPALVSAAGPPVVLVVLDTVRADHLRSYGYSRETMPALDAFGRSECARIERAYANYPASLETHASMFTGLLPPRHGAHQTLKPDWGRGGPFYPLPTGTRTLATQFAAAGYWSVAITANTGPLLPRFGIAQGFHVYDARPDRLRRRSVWARISSGTALSSWLLSWSDLAWPQPTRRARAVVDDAIAVVEVAGTRPFFLFLNLFDAHAPYMPPARRRGTFPGVSPRQALGGLDPAAAGRLHEGRQELTAEESEHLRSLYDAELLGMDDELSRLITRLRTHPRWSEMVVVITADHGEALGEHRLLEHNLAVYDVMLRVPLFIRWPGGPPALQKGTSSTRVYQSVDLFPLLLTAAGLPGSDGGDGVAEGTPSGPVYAWSFASPHNVRQLSARYDRNWRCVIHASTKLIRDDHGGLELYDLKHDPSEARDIAVAEPQLVAELDRLLSAAPTPKRHETRAVEPAVTEELRALGYVR